MQGHNLALCVARIREDAEEAVALELLQRLADPGVPACVS